MRGAGQHHRSRPAQRRRQRQALGSDQRAPSGRRLSGPPSARLAAVTARPCSGRRGHDAARLGVRRYTSLALQHAGILSAMTAHLRTRRPDRHRVPRDHRGVLAGIEATVDRWLQDDVVDIDTQRTGGLLELSFPNGSKIVLNTQPPLHELWLAARSGGFHYKYVEGRWRDTRDGREFFEALSACASEQAGRRAALRACRQRLNKSRMPLRSSSSGARGGSRLLEAQAVHAGSHWRILRSTTRRRRSPRLGRRGGLRHRHALERRAHVVDPDRQRQTAAGFAVAQLARRCRSPSRPPPPRCVCQPANQASIESLVVPVLP